MRARSNTVKKAIAAAVLAAISTAAIAEYDAGWGDQCAVYVETQYLNPRGLSWSAIGSAYRAWTIWDFGYGKDIRPEVGSIMVLNASTFTGGHGHVAVVKSVHIVDYNTGRYEVRVDESNARGTERITKDAFYAVDLSRMVVKREGNVKAGAPFPEEPLRGFIYTQPNPVNNKINGCLNNYHWLFGDKTGRWEDDNWKYVFTNGYWGAIAVYKAQSSNPYAWRYGYGDGWQQLYCPY